MWINKISPNLMTTLSQWMLSSMPVCCHRLCSKVRGAGEPKTRKSNFNRFVTCKPHHWQHHVTQLDDFSLENQFVSHELEFRQTCTISNAIVWKQIISSIWKKPWSFFFFKPRSLFRVFGRLQRNEFQMGSPAIKKINCQWKNSIARKIYTIWKLKIILRILHDFAKLCFSKKKLPWWIHLFIQKM